MRRILAFLLITLLLAVACGGGANSSGSSTAAGNSASSPFADLRMIPITTTRAGVAVSQYLTREEGGSLTATSSDGTTATLTVPAGALESRTLVSMIPVTTENGIGVELEPAGLWLDRNATLSFSRASGVVLVRMGAATETDRFVVTPAQRSNIAIARFRPVLVIDRSGDEALIPDWDWERDVAPRVRAPSSDPKPEDYDEFSVTAYLFENPAPSARERTPDQNDEVRVGAAGGVAPLDNKCDDRTSAAAARVAELATTAGGKATTAPKCVKRVLTVTAAFDGSMTGEGMTINFTETITGHGFFTASKSGDQLSIPLEGQSEGVQKMASLMGTGIAWGFGTMAGLNVPAPSMDKCSMLPLQGGVMSGTATLTDDSQIRFVLTPGGVFSMNCGEWGTHPVPPIVWDFITELGLTVPINLTVADGQNSVKTLGELVQFSDVAVSKSPNGSIQVSEDGFTASIMLAIGVFWSRADRCDLTTEEKAKGPDYEQQACGAGPA